MIVSDVIYLSSDDHPECHLWSHIYLREGSGAETVASTTDAHSCQHFPVIRLPGLGFVPPVVTHRVLPVESPHGP
eukprot:scaffold457966_cov11-Prasinocladus_malaysianus.AAC.1